MEQKEIWLDVEKTRRELLITYSDNEDMDRNLTYPLRIGGTDLSFLQENDEETATIFGLPKAISCYVILEFTDNSMEVPKIVYKDFKQVKLEFPYIPGFLAFREVEPMVDLIKKQMENHPELTPDYLMVDGNGILHKRKFGLACHVGISTNLPTIGVSKNFYALIDENSENCCDSKRIRDEHKENLKEHLKIFGDTLQIRHPFDDQIVGLALKSSKDTNAKKCIYVSIGHKISLLKAKELVIKTCLHKIPEPTRQADLLGREYIRNLGDEK